MLRKLSSATTRYQACRAFQRVIRLGKDTEMTFEVTEKGVRVDGVCVVYFDLQTVAVNYAIERADGSLLEVTKSEPFRKAWY